MNNPSRKVFVVFNPTAGNAGQPDVVRSLLEHRFTSPQWTCEIYETTGKEDIAAICRAACTKGTSLVISAGGDGTVVGVANGLVNSKVPLGILPMGTGNDLARALHIPLNLDDAADLLVGDHTVTEVDALKVGDKYFFSNVSVGVSPQMMDGTKSDEKKRFGLLAYIWTMLKKSTIFQLRRYTLTIDGRQRRIRASEILISNTTLLEKPPYIFGPIETLHDGQVEVYVITAGSLGEYLRLVWDLVRPGGYNVARLHHWEGKQSLRIETNRSPQLVQADGEVIGHTPVDIQIVPKALHVVMPLSIPASAEKGKDAPRIESTDAQLVSAQKTRGN